MPKSYPPEFRRKVLDLLRAGRKVAQIAEDLQISDQCIYLWRRQELIDCGQMPGVTSADQAELVAARKRIAELETELVVHRRAAELLREVAPLKARFAAIAQMVAEGLLVTICCRVLGVSEAGYYAWRKRPPSQRFLRHTFLAGVIRQIHSASRGAYGYRRIHAELALGRGVSVSHGVVETLMQRAGLMGLPGSRRRKPLHDTPFAGDLVDRKFGRQTPNM
jgi:transposase-like protein